MFSKGTSYPPRSLIALILGVTVVPLATLLWLGWRLLEQDRILEGQQAQQRVERAADLVVASLQRAVSFSEQQLAADSRDWPDGAVAITFRNGLVEAYPKDRVAYRPSVDPLPEPAAETFAQGEELEFRKQDYAAAAANFRELTKSSDTAIRAGALLRLGRNLGRVGRAREAFQAYGQLTAIDGAAIGGVPAGLIGRYARCQQLESENKAEELQAEAKALQQELNSGRWSLTASVYWLYAADAAKWNLTELAGVRQAEVFAEAASGLWERWHSLSPSGHESISVSGQNLAVVWRSFGGSVRALIAAPEFVESQWLAPARRIADEQRISIGFGDPNSAGGAPKAKRMALETALPWNLAVTGVDPPDQSGEFVVRRRLLIAGFLLLVAMAVAAAYLIVRAVSRELAVARLQSDFVAAVSHEFRTPLTALRQFTDMLRENKYIGEERRNLCYEAQARATARLTGLVESLLDFGRFEAGAYHYQFEQHDCTELVRRVVEDFAGEAETAGYTVGFSGNGSAPIEADSEALGRAVRNLLGNAVKYSPDQRNVEVGLSCRDRKVRIAVRDHGIGIPAHERVAIFAKFQRGKQARTRGIQGTGIGLAMVDEIVKAHRGMVEVESEPDKGSTFTIVLPVKE